MSTWGYKEVTSPHATRPNGCVLEHRQVAGQMLGRALSGSEVVHHIDSNRAHNDPSNLMVFASNADHIRFHAGGDLKKAGDIYTCLPKLPETKIVPCEVCGQPTVNKRYCSTRCAGFARRKVKHPTRDELAKLIASHSMCAIGRMHGVSDNAVRKWAHNYRLI